jgi:hypothetical protein
LRSHRTVDGSGSFGHLQGRPSRLWARWRPVVSLFLRPTPIAPAFRASIGKRSSTTLSIYWTTKAPALGGGITNLFNTVSNTLQSVNMPTL